MKIEITENDHTLPFFIYDQMGKFGTKTLPIDDISRHLYMKRKFYELPTLRRTMGYLNKNSVVCDCGANIGNHTIYWAHRVKKVIAIEPLPQNLELLARNIKVNGLDNVVVIDKLISDRRAKFDACFSMQNMGHVCFVEKAAGSFESTTLDEAVLEKIDFIKIDVEGAEDRVLAGAKRILSDKPIIFLEMHYPHDSAKCKEILSFLGSFGYVDQKDLFVIMRKK
jgi:FkbM family methyltransferase